jgi:hypothetical protein
MPLAADAESRLEDGDRRCDGRPRALQYVRQRAGFRLTGSRWRREAKWRPRCVDLGVVRLHPVLIVAARNYAFAFLLIRWPRREDCNRPLR